MKNVPFFGQALAPWLVDVLYNFALLPENTKLTRLYLTQ